MSTEFLDLKYRPQKFSDVIGNKGPVAVLAKRSSSRTLSSRSILLGGPKGCGKTTLARIISRSISCQSPVEGEPCNECLSCLNILNENSSSVFEFDAAAHGTVDRIRSIVDGLEYSNVDGDQTVLILDEAHRLSPASQDALLKSMEDRRIFCILCTTEPNKIRPAVRDRVDEYSIRPPDKEDIFMLLKRVCSQEKIYFSDECLYLIVDSCDRSPRSSINAIQSLSFMDDFSIQAVRNFFRYDSLVVLSSALALIPGNINQCLKSIDPVFESESSVWVRDSIIKIISFSIRKALNIAYNSGVPTFNIEPHFIHNWSCIAKDFGLIDKPNNYNMEICLYNSIGYFLSPAKELPSNRPSLSIAQVPVNDAVTIQIPKVIEKPKVLVKPSKSIEIDGVKFSSDENLTSIDDKIGPSRGPTTDEGMETLVQYDTDKVPVSEQEFSRGFIEKFSK